MRMTVPYAPAGGPAAGQARSSILRVGGVRRRLVVYTPADPRGVTMPLVLDLHGSTSYPEEQLAISGMAAAADEHGFAVLAPEGLDRSWNVPVDPAGPDDVRFLAEAIDAVEAMLPIDRARVHATGRARVHATGRARVYATGFSGGGRMASTLAGALGDRVAAIAPVAGLRFDAAHPPERPVPVLTFHGLADPVNPYDGGGPPYWQTGVEDAVRAWVRHNACAGARTERVSPAVTRSIYGAGPGSVILYRIASLGHQWPGSAIDLGKPFGPPATSPRATVRIAAFFACHRRHPQPERSSRVAPPNG